MSDRYEIIKKQLESFDLDATATERVVFLECYVNDAIPGKALVSLDHQSSVKKVIQLNRGTGTPSPWKLLAQIVWSYEPDKSPSFRDDFSSLGLFAKFGETQLLDLEETDDVLEGIAFDGLSSDYTLHFFERNFGDYSDFPSLEDSDLVGFVYVLFNELQPEICKIGYTDREPRIRAAELSLELGLNSPYRIALALVCRDAEAVEGVLHERLASSRVSKEFFKRDLSRFIDEFSALLVDRDFGGGESPESALVPYKGETLLFPGISLHHEITKVCTQERRRREFSALKDSYDRLSEKYRNRFWDSFNFLFGDEVSAEFEKQLTMCRFHLQSTIHSLKQASLDVWMREPTTLDKVTAALLNRGSTDDAWTNWHRANDYKSSLEEALTRNKEDLKSFSENRPAWIRSRLRVSATELLMTYLRGCENSYLSASDISLRGGEKIGFLVSVKTYDQKYKFCLLGLFLKPKESGVNAKAPPTLRMDCVPLTCHTTHELFFQKYEDSLRPFRRVDLKFGDFFEIKGVGEYLLSLILTRNIFVEDGYFSEIVWPMCSGNRVIDRQKFSLETFLA